MHQTADEACASGGCGSIGNVFVGAERWFNSSQPEKVLTGRTPLRNAPTFSIQEKTLFQFGQSFCCLFPLVGEAQSKSRWLFPSKIPPGRLRDLHQLSPKLWFEQKLPCASSSTWTKSIDQIWTELTIIFMKKVLSTDSCPGCLMCFVLPGTRVPGANHRKDSNNSSSNSCCTNNSSNSTANKCLATRKETLLSQRSHAWKSTLWSVAYALKMQQVIRIGFWCRKKLPFEEIHEGTPSRDKWSCLFSSFLRTTFFQESDLKKLFPTGLASNIKTHKGKINPKNRRRTWHFCFQWNFNGLCSTLQNMKSLKLSSVPTSTDVWVTRMRKSLCEYRHLVEIHNTKPGTQSKLMAGVKLCYFWNEWGKERIAKRIVPACCKHNFWAELCTHKSGWRCTNNNLGTCGFCICVHHFLSFLLVVIF